MPKYKVSLTFTFNVEAGDEDAAYEKVAQWFDEDGYNSGDVDEVTLEGVE
jgi:hypothetical protein